MSKENAHWTDLGENTMDEVEFGMSRDEIAFMRMKEFHRQRVNAVETNDVPLTERDGGILVVHFIPEGCLLSKNVFDGSILKEYGTRLRPLGDRGGNTRFNVDGFLNCSGAQNVMAYSQLLRDGRVESVMSDVSYSLNRNAENGPYAIRHGLIERAVFDLFSDYQRFCKAVKCESPLWLFSALVECKGHRMQAGRFRDFAGTGIDRSPAILPELKISTCDGEPQKVLRPWCDLLWQAAGVERSFNFDQEGNWREPH